MDQKTLKYHMHYNRETGDFRYRVGRLAGRLAGCLDAKGYVILSVNGEIIKAHRAAWLYVNGSLPSGIIDHRDGDRARNVFKNLRNATYALNRQNLQVESHANRTGFLGVTQVGRRFYASIKVDGIQIALGGHETAEQAATAYVEAKRRLHKFCTI